MPCKLMVDAHRLVKLANEGESLHALVVESGNARRELLPEDLLENTVLLSARAQHGKLGRGPRVKKPLDGGPNS